MRIFFVALACLGAMGVGVSVGETIGGSSPKTVRAPLGVTATTPAAFVTATLEPNCVWDNGAKTETVSLAFTGTWEFWNQSGVGRKLLWKSGTHYATDNWTLANGEALYFTQKGPTRATFSTCSGTVTLTVVSQ